VASDTSLRGYAPTTYCTGTMVLHLSAPRDTADPAAGYSQVSTPAGTMDVQPVVFGITPARAAPGEVVTVQGSGFGRGGSASVGGAVAMVAAWSDRAVQLVVPRGAVDGTVTLVRGEDGRSIAAGSFTLVAASPSSGGGGRPTSDTTSGTGVVEPMPGGRTWSDAVQAVAAIAPPVHPAPAATPPQTPRTQPQVTPPVIAAIPPPGAGGLHPPLLGMAALLLAGAALAVVAWRRRSLLATAGAAVAVPAPARPGPAWPRRLRPPFWKAVSALAGTLLVGVYVIAAFSTMTALAVALGFGASAPSPEGPVYLAAGAFVSVALTAIAVRYAYYYRCWAQTRHWFRTPPPVDIEALRARQVPYIKVQVTTKGGARSVIERSLDELRGILERQEWLQPLLSAEVVTEVEEESHALQERYTGSALAVTGITLPPDYQTPRGTGLKARALHHMCELRRRGFNRKPGRTFVVHFDEETLVDEANLLVLVDYLSRDPRPISQGPIVYPLEWHRTPWICRALESTRPFGCSECARVMEHPPPPHLHGSNLVVDEQVENRLGWDFGTVDGQPYVAEDLLFGLRAYAALGEGAFGWHGATMLEQPPFSLYWAVQQRLRWVLGALQGLRAMSTDAEYADIPRRQKRRLLLAIGFRVATYALGFPVGFAGLYFVLHPAQVATQWRSAFGLWHVLIIVSGVSWFLSYQIGMVRNLRYQDLGRRQRAMHAVVMVLMTPIAGFCETVGPFLAVVRWMFGLRRASWTPTPKQGQPRLRPDVS
jgi:hypothetical protein